MIKNASALRTMSILLATLLIGMVLGAAILGTVIRGRIGGMFGFMQADGFTQQMLDAIEPTDAVQEARLRSLILPFGEEVETTVQGSRAKILVIVQRLEADLQGELTEQQREALESRVDEIEAGIEQRRN